MTSPVRLPMGYLRSIAAAFLPDVATVLRYTETSTSDGVAQDWQPVLSDVPCRVSPRAATATEGLGAGGAAVRALSTWVVVVPFGTDVTERDRVAVVGTDRVDGRTFEVVRVGARSYEASRELLCELVL
jgi:hypothetical protein